MTILNIGLNDKDTHKEISINLARELAKADYTRLETSNTELTLICAVKDEVVTVDYLNNLVEKLNQDCIAVKFSDGKGILFHNKKANKDWGSFNNDYFIGITKTGGITKNFFR